MKKYLIILAALIGLLIALGWWYLSALAAAFGHGGSDSPSFTTTEPMIVRQLTVPAQTWISYDAAKTSARYQQDKPLNEKLVNAIGFPNDQPVMWGEMPITLISDNRTHINIRPVWEADIKPTHRFFALWRECNGDLAFHIKDNTTWQFDPNNFTLATEFSCGFYENFKAGSPKMQEMIEAWQQLGQK